MSQVEQLEEKLAQQEKLNTEQKEKIYEFAYFLEEKEDDNNQLQNKVNQLTAMLDMEIDTLKKQNQTQARESEEKMEFALKEIGELNAQVNEANQEKEILENKI